MWLKTVLPVILLSWICVAQSGKSISSQNRRQQFCNDEQSSSSAQKNEFANAAELHTIDHKSRKLLFWNSTKQLIEKLKRVGPLLKSKVRQKIRQIQLNMRSDLVSLEEMRKMREKYGPLGVGRVTGTFPPPRTTEDWRPRYNRTTNKYQSNVYNQQRNHNNWSSNSRNYYQNNYNNPINRNRYNNWQQNNHHSSQHSRQNYNNNFDRKTVWEHQQPSSPFTFKHHHSSYNERFKSHVSAFAATTQSLPQELDNEDSEDVYEPINATSGYDFTDSEEISTYGNILDFARKVSKYNKRYFTTTPQFITTKNTFNRNSNWGDKLVVTGNEASDYHHQQQQRLHHRQQGQQQQHQEQHWQPQQRHYKQQQHHGKQQQPHQRHQVQQQQPHQRYQDQQKHQEQQQQSYQRYQDQQQHLQQQQQSHQRQQQQHQSTLIQTSTVSTPTVPTNFSTFCETTNSHHVNSSAAVYSTNFMPGVEFSKNALKSTSSETNLENLQHQGYQFTIIPASTASTTVVSTNSSTVNKMTTNQSVNISTTVHYTVKMSAITTGTKYRKDVLENTSSTTLVDSLNESAVKRHHYYTGQWTKVFSSTLNGTFTVANLSNTQVEINTALPWRTKMNIPQWGSVDHQTMQTFNATSLNKKKIERHSTADNNYPEMFTGRSHLRYFNRTLNPHYNVDHTRRYAKRAYQAVSEALKNISRQVGSQKEVTVPHFQNPPSTWVAGFFGPITKISRVNTGTFSAPHRIVQRLAYSNPPLPEWGTPFYKNQGRSHQTRQPTYTEKRTQFSHRYFAGTFNPHYNVPTTKPTKETDVQWSDYSRPDSGRLRFTRVNKYTIRDRYFTPKKVHDRHHHHHHHQHVPFHKQMTIDYNTKHNFKENVTEFVDYNVKDPVKLTIETTTIDYNTKGTGTQIITTTINYNTKAKSKHKMQPFRSRPHRTPKGITWTPFHKFLHTVVNNQTAWSRKKEITGGKIPSFSTGTWSFSDYTPLTTFSPSSATTEKTKYGQITDKSQVEHITITNEATRTKLPSIKTVPKERLQSLFVTLPSEKKASTITNLPSTTIQTIKVIPEKVSSEPVLKQVSTQRTKCKKMFFTTNEMEPKTTIASKRSSSRKKQTGSGGKRKSSTVEITDKTGTTSTKPKSLKKSTKKPRTSRNTRRKGPYPTAPVIYYDEMEHTNEL